MFGSKMTRSARGAMEAATKFGVQDKRNFRFEEVDKANGRGKGMNMTQWSPGGAFHKP